MAGTAAGVRVGDRREVLLASIQGRRCRLQGLSNAQLYHGWFVSLAGEMLEFETKAEKKPQQGDLVYAEVDTLGLVLRFVCQVAIHSTGRMWLKVTSPIEERKQAAEPRLQIEQLDGKMEQGTSLAEIVVVDASESGFGFLTHTPLERVMATTIISSTHGDIAMTVEVRHTRKLADQGCLRGGAKIVAMDRVARARWTKVLSVMKEVD
jgi:hypothetical protein